MNEHTYVTHLKSYVDNGIPVPNYINDLSDKLDKLKIYNEGILALRQGYNNYAKVILNSIGVNLI